MRDLNIEFQEQYKRLDKLCKDMYSSSEGVSAYLEAMDKTPFLERRYVADWDDIHKRIKRARWMRNKLAHEISIDSDFCKQEDVIFISDFYKKILACNDPLAVVLREKNNDLLKKTCVNTSNSSYKKQTYSKDASSRKTSKDLNFSLFISNVVVAICCMIAIVIMWKLLPQTIPAHWSSVGLIDRYGSKNEFLIHVIVVGIFWLIDLSIFLILKFKSNNFKKLEMWLGHGFIALFQLAYVVFLIVTYAPYINA